MSAQKVTKTESKKWVGWFKPLGKGVRQGSLIAVPVEIFRETKISRASAIKEIALAGGFELESSIAGRIVVSVPSTCGTAVQRNRFRRIVKARFAKCRLRKEIVATKGSQEKNREKNIVAGGNHSNVSANKALSDSKTAEKGLWIRLLNRHRLSRKIRLEDWKRDFDAIEALYCVSSSSLESTASR